MNEANGANNANEAALDWIAATLLAASSRGAVTPSSVLFLLRWYATTGREDLRTAAETGLALGIDRAAHDPDPLARCEWLSVLSEASAVSDDEQLVEAIRSALPSTVERLEQLAAATYEPGEGLVGSPLGEQLRTADALLTAFDLTGRLPYPMLAEELLQSARRRWWDDQRGVFEGDFIANCEAVRVFSRLAILHRDDDYRASGVIAPEATYAIDAERTLVSLETLYRDHADAADRYGVALLDWITLSRHSN